MHYSRSAQSITTQTQHTAPHLYRTRTYGGHVLFFGNRRWNEGFCARDFCEWRCAYPGQGRQRCDLSPPDSGVLFDGPRHGGLVECDQTHRCVRRAHSDQGVECAYVGGGLRQSEEDGKNKEAASTDSPAGPFDGRLPPAYALAAASPSKITITITITITTDANLWASLLFFAPLLLVFAE